VVAAFIVLLILLPNASYWKLVSEGLEKGLSLLEEAGVSGKLDHYYLFHASRADLLRRLNRLQGAATAYIRALSLATNKVEQEYIRKRLSEVTE